MAKLRDICFYLNIVNLEKSFESADPEVEPLDSHDLFTRNCFYVHNLDQLKSKSMFCDQIYHSEMVVVPFIDVVIFNIVEAEESRFTSIPKSGDEEST